MVSERDKAKMRRIGHDLAAGETHDRETTAEIFESLEVEWTLVGALAANRYRSTPRFTTDVHTMAEFDPNLAGRFEAAGYEVTATL